MIKPGQLSPLNNESEDSISRDEDYNDEKPTSFKGHCIALLVGVIVTLGGYYIVQSDIISIDIPDLGPSATVADIEADPTTEIPSHCFDATSLPSTERELEATLYQAYANNDAETIYQVGLFLHDNDDDGVDYHLFRYAAELKHECAKLRYAKFQTNINPDDQAEYDRAYRMFTEDMVEEAESIKEQAAYPNGLALGEAQDAQRRADVHTILNAIYQYAIDNNGNLPELPRHATFICKNNASSCDSMVNLNDSIVGTYINIVPVDPEFKSSNEPSTGYQIYQDSQSRITVVAPHSSLTNSVSATR